MGRPINNLRKSAIRVKINKAGYKKLIQLAETAFAKMTANPYFTTPSPTLPNLATATGNLKKSTIAMGIKRARGSKAELAAAELDATVLRNLLTALAQYVENVVISDFPNSIPTQNVVLASSGFGFKDTRSVTPKLQFATFVRQTNNHEFPGSIMRINWRRPLGLIKGQRATGYNIYIGGKISQTTTKCNAIIPTAPGQKTDVVIVPFNSSGTGNSFSATIKGLS